MCDSPLSYVIHTLAVCIPVARNVYGRLVWQLSGVCFFVGLISFFPSVFSPVSSRVLSLWALLRSCSSSSSSFISCIIVSMCSSRVAVSISILVSYQYYSQIAFKYDRMKQTGQHRPLGSVATEPCIYLARIKDQYGPWVCSVPLDAYTYNNTKHKHFHVKTTHILALYYSIIPLYTSNTASSNNRLFALFYYLLLLTEDHY